MGWGLYLKDLYLNRVRRDELSDKLEEENSIIESCLQKLMILAGASPRDERDTNGSLVETWEDRIQREVRDVVDQLRESNWTAGLCQFALDNPNDVEESN